MTKRVFLIHGWEGSPEKDWLSWAKNQLEQKGYQVYLPEMPNPEHPEIQPWVNKLAQEIGKPEHTDIFIGHSCGCQAILRYLESLGEEKIDKVILVAPWHTLSEQIMADDDDRLIAKPWVETSIDFGKVREKANSFIALFSEDDELVPFEENKKWLDENLEIQTIVYKDKGHFNMTELPEVLKFF
jgi:uncharacterized protein